MTYTPVPTYSTGDTWNAAAHNTYVRDNFAAGAPDIFTSKGDLAVGQSYQVIDRLAVGANGEVLIADSSQTLGIRWGKDRMSELAAAKGDLFAATGANTLSRLAVGTNGHILLSDSTQSTGLKWGAEPIKASITAKGSLAYVSGSRTLASLAVGANGTVLKRVTTPSWGVDPMVDLAQAKGDLFSTGTRLPVGANNLWLQEDESNTPTQMRYSGLEARASCYINSSQTITSGTRIQFNGVNNDPDGAITTGASWQYTCPSTKPGWYLVMINVHTNGQSWYNQSSSTIRLTAGSQTFEPAATNPAQASTGTLPIVTLSYMYLILLKPGDAVYAAGAGSTFSVSSNTSSIFIITKIFPR